MARPGTDKQLYIDEINRMLAAGASMDEVTPTKLQRALGGRYNRIAEIIDAYKAEHPPAVRPAEPMPPWFKEWVAQVSQAAEATWFKISAETKKAVDVATEAFERKKAEYEAQRREDRDYIAALEDQVDELKERLDTSDHQTEILKHDQAVLEEKVASREKEISRLEDDSRALSEELAQVNAEREAKAAEASKLSGQVEQLQIDLQAKEKAFQTLSRELNRARDDLAAARQSHQALTKKVEQLQSALDRKDREIDQVRNNLAQENKSLSAEAAELRGEVKAKDKEIAKLEKKLADLHKPSNLPPKKGD